MAEPARRTTPWSLKGVSHDARAAAKAAAKLAGVPLGQWLSGAIRATGSTGAAADPADGSGAGRSHSTEPTMVNQISLFDDPGKPRREPRDPDTG